MALDPKLRGTHVRLEPLEARHALPLTHAAAADPSLYAWSMVPQGEVAMRSYIETALAWARDGHAIAFATVLQSDNTVIGQPGFSISNDGHGRPIILRLERAFSTVARSVILG